MVDAWEPASLRRRAAASAVDALPGMVIVAAVVRRAYRRHGGPEMALPRPLLAAFNAAGILGTALALARWGGTPGQQAVGIRTVDHTTGHHLTFRRALLRSIVGSAPSILQVALDPSERRQARREARQTAGAELAHLATGHADGPDGPATALEARYAERLAHPYAGCVAPEQIIGLLYGLARDLPAFWSSQNRTLHDRLARAIVIRTR